MILNKVDQMKKFDPQAVKRDSGVQLTFNNFLEDVLQPKSFKIAQTLNVQIYETYL